MDSEHEPGPVAQPGATAERVEIAAARYARLLFGEGEDGWIPIDDTRYMRIVCAPKGKVFTPADHAACNAVLFHECGIVNLEAAPDRPRDIMSFIITPEDMEWLREYGLGKTTAGSYLMRPTDTFIEQAPVKENPLAVLRENLKLAVLSGDGWRAADTHRVLKGERRECEVILPKAFLEKLDACLPNRHGPEFERKDIIRDMLSLLLPRIPVTASTLDGERGSMVTIAVKPEYYAALDAAIMAAKQQPKSNVCSIASAARLGGDGRQKH